MSDRIKFGAKVAEGEIAFLTGHNIEARKVLYIGVGPLGDFRYTQIRAFGRKALAVAARGTGRTEILCSPLHGPGYGLDERESFLSLVGGFLDGINEGSFPRDLQRIEIVEQSIKKAQRLIRMLAEVTSSSQPKSKQNPGRDQELVSYGFAALQNLSSFGSLSEQKTKLFVAMPFAPEHSDVWEIAIQESCQAAGVICERIDEQAYTGDILAQIKSRVKSGHGVLALLNDANPNVFLEVGFAWGMSKPTVLLIKKGSPLPFDLQSQKCIQYTSIANLRTLLTAELIALQAQGAFGRS